MPDTTAITLSEYVSIVADNGKRAVDLNKAVQAVNLGQITPADLEKIVYQTSGRFIEPVRSINGQKILAFNYSDTPTYHATNVINSNVGTNARGVVSSPISTTINQGGKSVLTSLRGVGNKVLTGASKLALPLTLAAIGCTLGKTIDETLYNANPDFWESIGAGTINPQTWSSIAGGDGTLGGSFINAIFGIDPQTEESQAYIDADAMSYLAYCLNNAGFFSHGESYVTDDDVAGITLNKPIYVNKISFTEVEKSGAYWSVLSDVAFLSQTKYGKFYCSGLRSESAATALIGTEFYYTLLSDGTFVVSTNTSVSNFATYWYTISDNTYTGTSTASFSNTTYNNITSKTGYFRNVQEIPILPQSAINSVDVTGWVMINGTIIQEGGLTGVGDQSGAVIPDFTSLTEDQYLPYLQQLYPDMFQDAIEYPVIQPDGTEERKMYVPITLPQASGPTDSQPITGNQTQANPEIDPSTAPDWLIQLLTSMLQQPINEPITDNPEPPENPNETGEGSSPQVVAPSGSASSLWKIYHPTQGQVDSFGAWLWSSNFIDQILKIFNNPMEAIIGLHKIYATPIDGGTTTIKVGYLDSGISSSYISQQYVTVSCGTVFLDEQFASVLDYDPFTDVKLYLPFIGIVPLNVNDVMRASITIEYGVDVITGACLAQVKISRDANDSILYQYSGNCSVQYPISSGSYMGIVSSIISVAGSVAATVASGGSAAPLALGAVGGIMGAHTSIQNSGSFSGNAGAMGCKIPYLILTRPQSKVALNADSLQGYSTNSYTTIGACSGYIKADSVHVVNVNATEEEMTEINNLILSGIII